MYIKENLFIHNVLKFLLFFTHFTVFKEGCNTHLKIKAFENYIQHNKDLYSFEKIDEMKAFTVDLKHLLKDEFIAEWTTFENDLNTQAEHTVNCLGVAMHQTIIQYITDLSKSDSSEEKNHPINLSRLYVRLLNHSPILQLKNLKVNYYGKLVSVRGTVIRVSNVKLICQWMEFQCLNCEGRQILMQPDGVYTLPTKCSTSKCRSQRFVPLLSSPRTVTENWQLLKLQECVGSEQCEGGRIPRTVECELTRELVDVCTPGDDVTITGIIRVRNMEEGYNKGKQASMFLLYIDVLSVVNNKNQNKTGPGTSGIEFSLTDYYAIQVNKSYFIIFTGFY